MTAKDIEEAFHRVGVPIDRRRLVLPDPIKRFGAIEVPLRLHHDVTTALKIEVVKKSAAPKA